MNVQQTVFMMIYSYPSHFPTRVAALLRLFDNVDTRWEKGELVVSRDDLWRYDPYLYDESYLVAKYEEAKGTSEESAAAADLMAHRQKNASAQFIADNASILSVIRSSSFTDGAAVNFHGRHFDDMPDDVTPDWLDAAKELARAIRAHRYRNLAGEEDQYADRCRKNLFEAQSLCKRFLDRFDSSIDSAEREERTKDLMREAAALGYQVIPRTPVTV